jgi:hypothetical protein
MTGRATTQAISATELNEGDSDAVRIRHQLDAWANASNRTPRLVATPAEDVSVESSGEAPLRQRNAAAPLRRPVAPRPAKATKAQAAKATKARTDGGQGSRGRWRAGGARRAARAADGFRAPTVPEAVPATPERAAPAAPLPLLQPSRWRRLLPIFQSQAWPRYFPAIRLRSWCSPPRWKPASW